MADALRPSRWLASRGVRGALLVVLGVFAVDHGLRTLDAGLHARGWLGFLLLAICLALALFNARKKLPFLPLLPARTWTRFHIVLGCLALVVFGFHLRWQWPDSLFNALLASVFLVVGLSGLLGWWLSRVLPGAMARSGEPLTLERIPQLRRDLGEAIRAEVGASVAAAAGSRNLANYYQASLHAYLQGRPPWLLPLRQRDPRYARVIADLRARRRYMNAAEQAIGDRLESLLDAHRNLDMQYAGQRLLRYWLFVHVPLTWSLLVFAAAHMMIVLSYRSVW